MKRMTIIKPDSTVGIDSEFYIVDCSDLPENFHALQWYEDEGYGEIEWDGRPKPENTMIISLDDYQIYITRWQAAKQEYSNKVANG